MVIINPRFKRILIVKLRTFVKSNIGIYLGIFLVHLLITLSILRHRASVIFTHYGMPDVDTDGTLWHQSIRIFTDNNDMLFNSNALLAYPYGYDLTPIPFFSLIYELNIFFIKLLGDSWQNLIFVANSSTILSYPFTGLASFLFADYFLKNRFIAFISSSIFTYSYYYLLMSSGSLSTNHYAFIPLYLLSFFYVLEKKKIKFQVLSALIFSLMFMANPYWAFFSGIFTVFFSISYELKNFKNRIRLLFQYFPILFITLVLVNLNYFIQQFYNFNKQLLAVVGKTDKAADQLLPISSYFIPSISHAVYSWGFVHGDFFLGYTALIIGFVGIFVVPDKYKKIYRMFLFAFFIAIIMSSKIPIFNRLHEEYFNYFGMFRGVSRMFVLASLFLSILAGFTLKSLVDKYQSSTKTIFFLTILLLATIIIDGSTNHNRFFRTTDFEKINRLYQPIKKDPRISAIMVYPSSLSNGTNGFPSTYVLLGQIIHRKPLANGVDPLNNATKLYSDSIKDLSNPETVNILAKHGVDTIIIHNNLVEKKTVELLKNDLRLEFIGRHSVPVDKSSYIAQNDLSRDISVFLIKSPSIPIDGNKADKVNAHKYVFNNLNKNSNKLILTQPWSEEWKLYSSDGPDLLFAFKKPLLVNHHYSEPSGYNVWFIDIEKLNSSKNIDSIVAFYRPHAFTIIYWSISATTLILLSGFIFYKFILKND